jgi:hypothetical protein
MGYLGEEGRGDSSLLESGPVHLLEEGVELDFFDAVSPQPVLGFALDESVHEVYAFPTPAVGRDLVELHLLGKYFLANFLAVGSNVGTLRE